MDNRDFPFYCMLREEHKQNITTIVEDFGLNVPLQWDGDVPPKITLSPEQSFLFMRKRLVDVFKKMLDEGYKDSFKVMMAYMLQLIERQGPNAQNLKKIFIAECLVPSTNAYEKKNKLPEPSCSKGVLERIILGLNQTMNEYLPDAIKEEILFNVNKIAFLNDGGLADVAQHLLNYCKDFQPIMDAQTPQAKVQALVNQVVSGVCDELTGGAPDELTANRLEELIKSPQYPANWGDQKDANFRSAQRIDESKEIQREAQFNYYRITGSPYSITFGQAIKNYIAFASDGEMSLIDLEDAVQKLEVLYRQGIRHGKDISERQASEQSLNGLPDHIPVSEVVDILNDQSSGNLIELNNQRFKIFERKGKKLLQSLNELQLAPQDMAQSPFSFVESIDGMYLYHNDVTMVDLFLKKIEESQPPANINANAALAELQSELVEARAGMNQRSKRISDLEQQLKIRTEELQNFRVQHAQPLLNIIDFQTQNSGPSVLNIAGFDVPEAGYGRWSIQDNASIHLTAPLPNQFVLAFTGRFSAGNENKDLPIKMGSTIVHIRHTTPWNEFTQRILVDLKGEQVDKIEFGGYSLHPAGHRSIGVMVRNLKIQPIE